jgi:PAS domain S-box-containing protein
MHHGCPFVPEYNSLTRPPSHSHAFKLLVAMPIASPDAHLVLNCTPQLVCTTAPDGTIVFLNNRWFEFTGRSATEIVDKELESFWIGCVHPDDRETVYAQWAAGVAIGQPFEGRYRIFGHDGEYHWFFSNAIPMYSAANGTTSKLVGWVCTSTNIQPQVDAETRFRRLIETSFVGLCISEPNGTITYMNPSLLNLLGYDRNEVESGKMSWKDLTPPEFAAIDAEAARQLTATGICQPYEKVNIARDGRRIPILVGATCMRDDSGISTENACFILDLTNLKRAESALIQSEKLAAVGRLAASISHEINNPLEAITNLIYIAKSHSDLPPEVAGHLAIAEAEVLRCSQITTQTLRFHRQGAGPTSTTAAQLFDSVITLYQGRLTNRNITVHRGTITPTPFHCLEGEIRQVLSNLVANAIDAMRHGGRLILRAHRTSHRTGAPGVRIIIADDGHGMPPEVQSRIFQPFYTTREMAGTGLGLWISKDIIESHAGHLKVRSRPQNGTVFSVFLPIQN